MATEHAGDLLAVRQGPSANHLLGTDTLGRDVLNRLLVGSRVSMIGVAEAVIVVLALGVPLGLTAGYFGGWIDRTVNWLADLAFSMPGIVIILVVLSVFPQSMLAGMGTLGVLAAPALMRLTRSATLPVREELYIAAGRVSGLSRPYIISRHVLPRVAGAVIVQASLLCAVALLVQTGLSFLGLLVAAPAPSWGGMVADGISVIVLQPWLIWPPGIAIALTILAFGLLGDAVRDATTERWSPPPRRRSRRSTPPPSSIANGSRERTHDGTTGEATLLSIEHLTVTFGTPTAPITVVEDVSFDIAPGEAVGLVGESGCG
ncbi:MAG: ABC transporter permease subunit, partial [Solirubrobacteraceae bacterium]